MFVFYAASCVFVAPKNLLALPPVGGKGLKDLRNLVFNPGFGWAIGGAYFLGDLATKSLTGESIGQHLNDYYGDKPVVSW